jgi:YesN/AraC family two-component response regulator
VREAAHLLANTEETLEAIAEKTGFANRHYLSRVFKKVTGDSPASFRHKHGSASASAPS